MLGCVECGDVFIGGGEFFFGDKVELFGFDYGYVGNIDKVYYVVYVFGCEIYVVVYWDVV